MGKLRVGVIFGGQSGEHEVSLMSAINVIRAMDKGKYEIVMIGITKDGHWYLYEGDPEKIPTGEWQQNCIKAFLPPDAGIGGLLVFDRGEVRKYPLDVVFPVLHGPRGEDGTIQGLFELARIPYVGCGVLSSALGMDKVYTKHILKVFGIPHADFEVVHRRDLEEIENITARVEERFGYPCFVKPANLGSSVGITKAHNKDELIYGLRLASTYDRKILVERFIDALEIECSVLGNEEPVVSPPGQIIPSNEFYDYVAKYFDGGKSKLLIPAPISEELSERIKEIALKTYRALDCSGMARVDFLVDRHTEEIYVNEINTIPGFTKISMYPKLLELSGISYSELIDRLIELALKRFEK